MDIDPDVSNWILDFLLRQPLEDRTLNTLLRTLPLPNNRPNLKTSLLLKKLESDISQGSISESALDLLEQLEELLFQQGNEEVSDRMKHAYCAVAVDCTVRCLENWNKKDPGSKFKFFEAVKRVWRERVGRMEKMVEKGGLGSEELWGWKDEMEAAAWEDSVCENVVKRSAKVNAIEAVRAYLREEWERIGPSFIELVAQRVRDEDPLKAAVGTGCGAQRVRDEDPLKAAVGTGCGAQRVRDEDPLKAAVGTGCGDVIAGKQETVCRAGQNTDASKDSKDVQKEKSRPQSNSVGYNRSRRLTSGNSRGVKITDSDEMTTQSSDRNNKLPRSPEVNRVQEALESSSLELQAVVKDPLPDALKLAETISGMAGKSKNHDPAEMNHVEANRLVVDSAGVVQATGRNGSNVNRSSLMERNSSARTYQWDESIDGSSVETADRRGRPQLPSPKKICVSPLGKYELKNGKKRRANKRWSPLEEDTLRAGVQKYGRGNWKVILNDYHHIFEDRTEVDLKDKWRNLTRY